MVVPPDDNRIDAFISYSRSDVDEARFIYNELIARGGLKVFIDYQITPGKNWLQQLSINLASCEVFLFLIKDPPEGWQLQELQVAIQSQIDTEKPYIIPVILPSAKKGAFFGNKSLAFIHRAQAAQFRSSCEEIDIIDGLISAIKGNSRVYVSNRALPRADQLPSGFQADLGRLTTLLVGNSVYKARDICIRELIQNANDARIRYLMSTARPDRGSEIIVAVDPDNKFFDVIDFGDGMSSSVLLNSFSVLGRSMNTSFYETDGRSQSIDASIIGKFGVGFVSTFMIAQQVVISTKSSGEPAYHLRIHDPTEPFIYSDLSECGRDPGERGTTVRVYLMPDFANGAGRLHIGSLVKSFCRHALNLSMEVEGRMQIIDSGWNVDDIIPVVSKLKSTEWEIRLSWATDNFNSIKLSNGGFYVLDLDYNHLGDLPSGLVTGEINVAPGFVDVNLARDNVVSNEKLSSLRDIVGKAIVQLVSITVDVLKGVGAETKPDSLIALRALAVAGRKASIILQNQLKANRIGMIDVGGITAPTLLLREALIAFLAIESNSLRKTDVYKVVNGLRTKEIAVVSGPRSFSFPRSRASRFINHFRAGGRYRRYGYDYDRDMDVKKFFPENCLVKDYIYVESMSIPIQLRAQQKTAYESNMLLGIDLKHGDVSELFPKYYAEEYRRFRSWDRRRRLLSIGNISGLIRVVLTGVGAAVVVHWYLRQVYPEVAEMVRRYFFETFGF